MYLTCGSKDQYFSVSPCLRGEIYCLIRGLASE
jgi:hypothetical protein